MAQKHAQNNDLVRGRAELEVYHFKRMQYERMVAVYKKACMIRDTVEHTHSIVQVSQSLQRQSRLTPKLSVEEVDALMSEWEDIFENTREASEALSARGQEVDLDSELEELKSIELSFNMPSVDATRQIVSESHTPAHRSDAPARQREREPLPLPS